MNGIRWVLATVVVASLLMGAAQAATVTTYNDEAAFLAALGPDAHRYNADSDASGTPLTTQVSGITFSSVNSALAGAIPVQVQSSSGAASRPNLISGGYVSGSPGIPQAITLQFSPYVAGFGAAFSPTTPDAVMASLSATFQDGTSQTFPLKSSNKPVFFGLRSSSNITRVDYVALKGNGGQGGFKNYGIDNLAWLPGDGAAPVCTAQKVIEAGVLGFNGTSTDQAPGDTGIASVTLQDGVNVTLTCSSPFPAACGTGAVPAPSVAWRIAPSAPGVDGSGTVLATDTQGQTCTFHVTFTAFEGGETDHLLVCQDVGVALLISNATVATPGQIICGSSFPGPGEPPFPAGYEPSPESDPFPCRIFTIKSPISGITTMIYKKDGTFEPRLRLLFSRFDGAIFPPFSDVTESVEEIDYVIPDPTRVSGKGGWSQVKVACAVQAEICNGLDDDGDGQVDEGIPTGAQAVDCAHDGYPLCATGASTAVDCSGNTVPLLAGGAADGNDNIASINAGAAETCNGLDDNCNGGIDEGSPAGGAACVIAGQLGVCAEGVTSCANGPMECVPTHVASPETCNGLDDDCDGQVDEGHPAGGEEVCNGKDDDCDDLIDEGLGTLSCGVGACARTVDACSGGTPQTCVPGTPSAETCNGLDDDCDGATDEELGSLTCGTGACFSTVDACVGGSAQTCVPGSPSTETCNGVDDDCDGETDEGLGTVSCGLGVCTSTVDACVGGVPQTCVPGSPAAEVCNGLDDDCDGTVDELGITWSGLLQPVNQDGSSIFQWKSTIPLKFRLTSCSGEAITTATATLEVVLISTSIQGTVDEGTLPNLRADIGNIFRFDAKGSQYIYNLGTKTLLPGKTYLLRITIDQNVVHETIISLR